MDNVLAFQLYRSYAQAVRKNAAEMLGQPMKEVLGEDEFLLVWQSLPNSERRAWQARFSAGYEQIIRDEASQYAAVLVGDEFASLKAA